MEDRLHGCYPTQNVIYSRTETKIKIHKRQLRCGCVVMHSVNCRQEMEDEEDMSACVKSAR